MQAKKAKARIIRMVTYTTPAVLLSLVSKCFLREDVQLPAINSKTLCQSPAMLAPTRLREESTNWSRTVVVVVT